MAQSLYIIDVFSLVFQVYHAIPPMTGPAGQPTNAVFGYTRDLLILLRQKQPSRLIAAIDSPGEGTRNEIFADYKANRDEMPEDLRSQIPQIVEVMEAFGIPVIGCEGWEADDVFATLSRSAAERGFDVSIVTSDKDARQLLGPRVKLYNVRKDAFFDESDLQATWGIRADQVIDFQSLVGDSVDNVPGVPLVGPKKATALLEQFGTLEEVLANAEKAKGPKLRENLKTFADQALMSRELVTLNRELPIEVDWEASEVGRFDVERLTTLFRQYGFRRFADDVRALTPAVGEKQQQVSAARRGGQQSLFPETDRESVLVDTDLKFADFLAQLRKQRRFCVDLETTGLDAVRADIVGWAFSWEAGVGYYLPIQAPEGQATLAHERVVEALKPILESDEVAVTNQNIKYDMLVLRRAGIALRDVDVDPMVCSYLLDAGARSHSLDALAQKYLNHTMIPITDLIGKGRKQIGMAEVDVARVAEYAAEDADVCWRVAEIVTQEVKDEKLWDLYWNLERPLISVLTEMEFTGIRVNCDELRQQSSELGIRLDQLVEEIHEDAGREFNIDSPKQLGTILFEELKLPVIKKTKTGASTDQSVLEKLADLHPLPRRMIEHRQLAKLKNTYLDALPELINPETGRIHASFNQVVAATGRLSSSNPNLQNIPIRTEEGRRVRRAFVPGEEGWRLVCADYSQIELRMLAHFSSDPALIEAFEHNTDIHACVAADVFGVAVGDVDSNMRRMAKAVNFGIVYGQSSYGLAATLKIPQEEAAEFIESYFARYSRVERYMDGVLEECARSGFVRTILGRRRAIEGIRPVPNRQRNMPERTAINTVIQGSAADLIKQAMLRVHEKLAGDKSSARMLLQIHDELVFECPEAEVAELVAVVREAMEQALPLSVPLTVDVSVGVTWLDVEPFS
ncbi:MAG: DNA polymerase I [Planctomycetaceae bacterium]|nr:DNA polymerase I [Planctomycetaceae bacterium]